MTAFAALRHPAAVRAAAMPIMQATARACAVRLVDRRTGKTHRLNGGPLVIFTRRPDEAASELLLNRDPAVWEVRIEPLDPEVRR